MQEEMVEPECAMEGLGYVLSLIKMWRAPAQAKKQAELQKEHTEVSSYSKVFKSVFSSVWQVQARFQQDLQRLHGPGAQDGQGRQAIDERRSPWVPHSRAAPGYRRPCPTARGLRASPKTLFRSLEPLRAMLAAPDVRSCKDLRPPSRQRGRQREPLPVKSRPWAELETDVYQCISS